VPVGVAIFTFVIFSPALRAGFVWDDDPNILQNPQYRGLGWAQLRWMFTNLSMGHYQPLGWLTLGLDYVLWGMNPFGYHLTNVALHCVNAVIFYFVALRLLSVSFNHPAATREHAFQWAAGLSALLFSIHPLRVEAVAWITERRGLVAGLFFLLAVYCYLRSAAPSENRSQHSRWQTASVVCYGLSLLSKVSGIALPLVLIVLDFYPLRRVRDGVQDWWSDKNSRVRWEKLPFFLLALVSAVAAISAEHQAGAVEDRGEYGTVFAITQVFFGLAFYLWKTLVPIGLSPLYRLFNEAIPAYWPISPIPEVILIISIGIVTTLSIVFLRLRYRWPAAMATWICYLVLLAPVLGVIQVGQHIVADRYSYLANLGWAILASGFLLHRWLSARGHERTSQPFIIGATILSLVILGGLSWKQVQVWHDSESLWRHAIGTTPSALAYNNLGAHLARVGRQREAIEHYSKTLLINPAYPNADYNLATLLAYEGDLNGAVSHYHRAIELNPTATEIYSDLGMLLAGQKKFEEAAKNFRQALKLRPNDSQIHFNVGNALARAGDLEQATEHFREALRLKPDYAEAYNNLGRVTASQGQLEIAIGLFKQAIDIRPDYAEAHENLGRALAQQGKRDDAVRHLEEAVRILKSRRAVGSPNN